MLAKIINNTLLSCDCATYCVATTEVCCTFLAPIYIISFVGAQLINSCLCLLHTRLYTVVAGEIMSISRLHMLQSFDELFSRGPSLFLFHSLCSSVALISRILARAASPLVLSTIDCQKKLKKGVNKIAKASKA